MVRSTLLNAHSESRRTLQLSHFAPWTQDTRLETSFQSTQSIVEHIGIDAQFDDILQDLRFLRSASAIFRYSASVRIVDLDSLGRVAVEMMRDYQA